VLNNDLHDPCSLSNFICVYGMKDDERGNANGTYGEKRDTYSVLVKKPEGKRPIVRPRRRWKNNIKIDLQ